MAISVQSPTLDAAQSLHDLQTAGPSSDVVVHCFILATLQTLSTSLERLSLSNDY